MKRTVLVSCLALLVGCSSAFERGFAHQRAGELDQARDAYRDAGERAGALYNLAILEETRDPSQAQALYRQALELDPHLLGAWVNGTQLWIRRGQADSAEAWAGVACQLLVDHPEPFIARARLALSRGAASAAAEDLDRALEREPGHVGALALKLLLHSDTEERLPLAEQLSAAAGRHLGSEAVAGKALRAVGEEGLALLLLRHAVLSSPLDRGLLLELGLCLAELERNQEAMVVLWRARAAGSTDARLARALERLYQREIERLQNP